MKPVGECEDTNEVNLCVSYLHLTGTDRGDCTHLEKEAERQRVEEGNNET